MSSARPLTLEEASCPICLGILIQPITTPCSHTLCATCLRTSLKHCQLSCPLCRRRLSVWLRRSSLSTDAQFDDSLVDSRLWRRVQQTFPQLVQRRLAGVDDDDVVVQDISGAPRDGVICSPGDVGAEFAACIQADIDRREHTRHSEWAASRRLILELLKETSSVSTECSMPPPVSTESRLPSQASSSLPSSISTECSLPSPASAESSLPPPIDTSLRHSRRESSNVKRKRRSTSSPRRSKKIKQGENSACTDDGVFEETLDKQLLDQQLQIERQLQQEHEDRILAEQMQEHFNLLQSNPSGSIRKSYSLRSSR